MGDLVCVFLWISEQTASISLNINFLLVIITTGYVIWRNIWIFIYIYILMFFWPYIMNWLYINYQLLCTNYYLFIKYLSPLHISSFKSSSSGGYSCIHAAYGTVTLYESSWWFVGTQLEWELPQGEVVGRASKTPYQQPPPYSQFSLKLCTYKPSGTLIESDSTICCICTTVSSWRWVLEARNM